MKKILKRIKEPFIYIKYFGIVGGISVYLSDVKRRSWRNRINKEREK